MQFDILLTQWHKT